MLVPGSQLNYTFHFRQKKSRNGTEEEEKAAFLRRLFNNVRGLAAFMRTDRLMFLALTLCFQAFQGLPAWAGLDLDGFF
jgi:hypothetical protein